QQSGVDWWLVCDGNVFKFRYLTPLLGRQFLHGVMDCYTLFRDAYHLCGYALPDFHRPNLWWEKGENLYVDNMTEHGFYRVDEPQEGDVVLISFGARFANHAAIYLGNQLILHHCPHRLSKRDLYGG